MDLQTSIRRLRENTQDGQAWKFLLQRLNGQIVYQITHRLKLLNMDKEDLKQEISLFLFDRIIPRPSLRNRNNNGIRKEIDITKTESQIYSCLCFEINNFVLRKINQINTRTSTKLSYKDDNGKYYKDKDGKKITFYLKYDKDKQQYYFIDNKTYIYLDLKNCKQDISINKQPLNTNYIELTDKHESHADEIKYDQMCLKEGLITHFKSNIDDISFTFRNNQQIQQALDYILEHDYKQGRDFVRSQEASKICKIIKPVIKEMYGLGQHYKSGRTKQKSEESLYQFK